MTAIGRWAAGLAVLVAIGAAACSAPNGEPPEALSGRPTPTRTATTAAPFGRVDDTPVQLYTLTNRNGLVAKITNYGAIVTELHVPGQDRQARRRRARLRESRRLREGQPVLRRDRRPRRQSDRRTPSSRSTASSTSSTRTTSRTTCTAARRAGTRWSGARAQRDRRRPGAEADLRVEGRRGGLSGHGDRAGRSTR